MELSSSFQGSHASVSPCGTLLCSIARNSLRIQYTHDPDRSTEVPTPIQSKDVASLKWSDDSTRIAIHSHNSAELIDLDDADFKVRLDNGSGGLGKLASVEFLDRNHLLAIWEFGRAKTYELETGKVTDLAEVKTPVDGSAWQIRPSTGQQVTGPTLAVLSRNGADDSLSIYFPVLSKSIASTKIATLDAQELSWSPDGRWLAIRDTPTSSTSVRFYTPDGHPFRAYPASPDPEALGLGVKMLSWSGDSRLVALSNFDGKIVLLNTRTFAPLAIIEHTTTIHQISLDPERQAVVWQEAVSPSNQRTYTRQSQPISPPLSRTKASTEPSELGVAEAVFSCDGAHLASRDERMLNTVWIWDTTTLAPHTILLQHANVRKLHWHPSRSSLLMIDCGESIAYLFDVAAPTPPSAISITLPAIPQMRWLPSTASAKPIILAATRATFTFLYPEGADTTTHQQPRRISANFDDLSEYDEGASEDSILDILSGRKPMPLKTEPSYTEMVDFEMESEETVGLDDTFREKRKTMASAEELEIDPLDDSQIF